jgi:predicted RNase H-like HicB family nuclease
MKDSSRYAKVVEWSEADGCYIGRAPGLMDGGVHGTDERAVFDELCDAVDEVIAIYQEDGKPLPPPTNGCADLLEGYAGERHPGFEQSESALRALERRMQQPSRKSAKD